LTKLGFISFGGPAAQIAISIITDYDVYRPGMTVSLRFIRMKAFPIRVTSEFSLIPQDHRDEIENCWSFIPVFNIFQKDRCMGFRNINEMNTIKWELPVDLKPGRDKIKARFCDDVWADMPPQIQTPDFEINTF
jgi:hypothetical protein